jgi:phage portal protein BeeE
MDLPSFSWLRRRRDRPLSFEEYQSYFTFGGLAYQFQLNQTIQGEREEIGENFLGYIHGAYRSNSIVYACARVRELLFSEARFQFRRMNQGRPGPLFGSPELARLERPWPGGTTGDLLMRAIQDADLGGNFFAVRQGDGIKRMRPDWVTIVLGSMTDGEVEAGDLEAEVIGYLYHPGGRSSGREPVPLLREQVAHWAPSPDPLASYRGMSWLTPALRDILGDKVMTEHRLKFFENGATPNMIVNTGIQDANKFKSWVERFRREHESVDNAYKTLFLAAGADATVVGSHFKQIDFKVVQGAGETRIAADAGVPPVIVGLSEGLDAATYSNYSQARRRLSDGTMRPLWRMMAGALSNIIEVPTGAELWYDDRDIMFLQEDMKDKADVQERQSRALKSLTDAGYTPDSARDAIIADDLSLLKHSGFVSAQLKKPGEGDASGNGKVPPEAIPEIPETPAVADT